MRPVPHLLLWLAGLRDAETQTTERERQALARYASGRSRIVEVGVWHGVTTAVLRRAMAPDGVLWAVDPFPAGRLGFSAQRPIARRTVARVPRGTVEWIRETGREAGERHRASGLPPLDFVFLDADHAYDAVMDDWNVWSPLVAPGGSSASTTASGRSGCATRAAFRRWPTSSPAIRLSSGRRWSIR